MTIAVIDQTSIEKVKVFQPFLQRFILLIVLGYEAAGCLFGGNFLIAAPDGRYMDMPVDILHGVFRDFLIPGIILFGLGILNTMAFISVMLKKSYDWFMAGLSLGGLYIWFVVEIIILQELHWLHVMWAIPVLLGWVFVIPLIAKRFDSINMQKALMICGIFSTLWYAVLNIIVPMYYEGYSSASLTVSELSAIGAPTRIIWVVTVSIYPLLFSAFGWGVIQSSGGNRKLRIVGDLIIVYSIVNLFWPPMHMREVIAAGKGTLSDTLHLVWAAMSLIFMMLMMGYGAAGLGKKFRRYTFATWAVFLVFGILTFTESPNIEINLPTPFIGVWERINMGAFFLWVVVLAFILLRRIKTIDSHSFKQ